MDSLSKIPPDLQDLVFESNIDVNQLSDENISPLALATQLGDLKLIQKLIEKGADINAHLPQKYPPLLGAIKKQNKEILHLFLNQGADVNITNSEGDTPIIFAAKYWDKSIILILAERGADVNVTNNKGASALMFAYSSYSQITKHEKLDQDKEVVYDFESFCVLIELGADVNIEMQGLTFLSMLLSSNHFNEDFIIHLLNNGARVSNSDSVVAIHKCIVFKESKLLFALIQYGFPPTVLDKTTNVCMVKEPFLSRTSGVLSPLCMALLMRLDKLAQFFIDIGYLTTTDLFLLPRKDARQLLGQNAPWNRTWEKEACENILKSLKNSVPSLFQISHARVSDLVGCEPGRKDRLMKCKIPRFLIKSLMFECVGDFDRESLEIDVIRRYLDFDGSWNHLYIL